MKRLPDNFRPALDEIAKSFKYSSDMSNEEINKNYKKINQIFTSNNCESYDINNVLHNYHIDNSYSDVVSDMRKLTIHRNKGIVRKLYKTKAWVSFLGKMKGDMNELYSDYIHKTDVENGVVSIMKKYSDNWLGFWSLIDMTEGGEIKDINLIDIEDTQTLKTFLSKNHKLKTKKQIKDEEMSENGNQ